MIGGSCAKFLAILFIAEECFIPVRAGTTWHGRRAALSNSGHLQGSWNYQGCVSDSVGARTMVGSKHVDETMTNTECVRYCASEGYSFAGTEYAHECFCANNLNAHTLEADGDCNMACAGNSTESCGGPDRMTLYYNGATPPAAPSVFPGTGYWNYAGCYTDGPSRALSVKATLPKGAANNNAEDCIAYCATNKYTYAGLEYANECYCGSEVATGYGLASDGEAQCNMVCSGAPSEICGGPNRLTMYHLQPPPDPSWQAVGCYTDSVAHRSLSVPLDVLGGPQNMTQKNCQNICNQYNYIYAGVEYSGECFCDNAIRNDGQLADDGNAGCNMPCNGAKSEICGGPDRLTLFKYGIPANPSASSSASVASASVSASALGWTSLGCYTDSVDSRSLPFRAAINSPMTIERCKSSCKTNRYTLAGLEYGSECYCGNALQNSGSIASDGDAQCNMACAGNSTQICGGSNRLNLFTYGAATLSSSVYSSSLFSPSASSQIYSMSSSGFSSSQQPSATMISSSALNSSSLSAFPISSSNTATPSSSVVVSSSLSFSASSSVTNTSSTISVSFMSSSLLYNISSTSMLASSSATFSFNASATQVSSVAYNSSSSTQAPMSSSIVMSNVSASNAFSSIAPSPTSASSSYLSVTLYNTSSTAYSSLPSSRSIYNTSSASSNDGTISSTISNPTSSFSLFVAYNSSSTYSASPSVSIVSSSSTTSQNISYSYSSTLAQNSTSSIVSFSSTISTSASLLNSSSAFYAYNSTSSLSASYYNSSVSYVPSATYYNSSSSYSSTANHYDSSSSYSPSATYYNISSTYNHSVTSSQYSSSLQTSYSNVSSVAYYSSANVSSTSSGWNISITSSYASSTVSSSSSATSSFPTGWMSLGCYTDNVNKRTFANRIFPAAGAKMTVETCQTLCLSRSYYFAGLEYGNECYCDSAIRNGVAAPDGAAGCNMACEGNSTQSCGGPDRMNAYQYVTDPNAVPSSTSATTPTASGLPTGWSYKGCWTDNYLGRGRSMNNQQQDDGAMTIGSCVNKCKDLGYPIAGMEYSYQCFCDKTMHMDAPQSAEGDCNTPCAGSNSQTCGGPDRISVYSSINGSLPVLGIPSVQKSGLSGQWKWAGCLSDNNDARRTLPWRMVDEQNTTVTQCLDRCAKYGYPVGGLEYGSECFCGDYHDVTDSGATLVAEGQCNFVCSGNGTGYCGGARVLGYYTWDETNPLFTWSTPADQGVYQFLIGGVVIPLVTNLGINGKVTFLEKFQTGAPNTTGAYEFDPSLDTKFDKAWREMHVSSDIFCSASLTLPDKFGRQINIGGWSGGSTYGVRMYTPDGSAGVNGTNDWVENPDLLSLQNGRWYPSAMIMANGSVLVVGGESGSNAPPVPTMEILPRAGPVVYQEWLERTDPFNLYPFLAVLPSGGIFVAYYHEARILDEATFATTRSLPMMPGNVDNDDKSGRSYPLEGTMVLLPQHAPYTDPLGVLICGGSTDPDGSAIDNCLTIRPEVANDTWTLERMPSKRVLSCIAELPDGTYLILNGATKGVAGFGLAEFPNLDAVLYDPSKPLNKRMSKMASTTIPRLYHSEATLLLDGRVLVTGSDPQDQTGRYDQEYRVEVFIPPYLRSGLPRPAFKISTKSWAYGGSISFTLQAGNAANVRVSLLGSVASTHGNSMGQRTIFPDVSCASSGACTVTVPPNAHVCPPGWFKMFVLDGPTPSVGQWVQIGGDPASLGNWPNYPDFYPLPGV